jgi:hypothetical protein
MERRQKTAEGNPRANSSGQNRKLELFQGRIPNRGEGSSEKGAPITGNTFGVRSESVSGMEMISKKQGSIGDFDKDVISY